MVKFTLQQEKRGRNRGEIALPEEMKGHTSMLEKMGIKEKATAEGLSFPLLNWALGQKLMKITSEIAFLKRFDFLDLQSKFNRFFNKVNGDNVLAWLILALPKSYLSDHKAILSVDDTPVKKSGKKMKGSKKFHSNGVFYHGYELVTASLTTSKGTFPLGFALHTKHSASKIDLSKELILKVLSFGLRPAFIVFDAWYNAKVLLDFIASAGLFFLAPLKRNRCLFYRCRGYHAKDFIRLFQRSGKKSFEVFLKGFPSLLRLIVFKRQFKKGGSRFEILITNDFNSSIKTLKNAYLKRWSIESLFRASKQSFSLEDFHNRSLVAINNHLAFTFCAVILVSFLKSLFFSLQSRSLAWVRTYVFFKKISRTLTSQGHQLCWSLNCPDPIYFKRFGVVPLCA